MKNLHIHAAPLLIFAVAATAITVLYAGIANTADGVALTRPALRLQPGSGPVAAIVEPNQPANTAPAPVSQASQPVIDDETALQGIGMATRGIAPWLAVKTALEP